MDDMQMRIHVLERGQAVQDEQIAQLEKTDQRYASFAKWALPIALTLLSGALTFQASETRALTNEVRSLVSITARIEERLNSTDRRVERIEARLETPAIMSE